MDEERAAQLRDEAHTLFLIRNMALMRVESGNERALPMMQAADALLVELEFESEAALEQALGYSALGRRRG